MTKRYDVCKSCKDPVEIYHEGLCFICWHNKQLKEEFSE